MTPSQMKLKHDGIKRWREALWKAQGGACRLSGYPLHLEDAVADHSHDTGHMRGVLYRGSNSILGVIENNRARFGLTWPMVFAIARNLEGYMKTSWGGNPLHPDYKDPSEKRLARNAKERKRRKLRKGTIDA